MSRRKPRVAVLTDYMLHPINNNFLAVAENQSLINLTRFLQHELEWAVDVFQVSPIPERRFQDLMILGIDTTEDRIGMFPGLNSIFAQVGLDYDLRIYFHWHVAFPKVCHRSIVVSHGIFWDSASTRFNRLNPLDREEWKKRLLYGIIAPAAFVVEDRCTINVIKATWPGYDHRLVYLPPGVNLDRFKPPDAKPASERIRVICPQDFTYEQGINEILCICKIIAKLEPAIEFHIVGHMKDFADNIQLAHQVREMPNCRFYWVPVAHLPALYQSFDFALLPFRATEGASLYCLQAMGCGLPVVAGLAGGLSEMVIDGWNGRLVFPEVGNLIEAVIQLSRDVHLRLQIGDNARRLAEGYPDSAWKRRWKSLLEQVLSNKPGGW